MVHKLEEVSGKNISSLNLFLQALAERLRVFRAWFILSDHSFPYFFADFQVKKGTSTF